MAPPCCGKIDACSKSCECGGGPGGSADASVVAPAITSPLWELRHVVTPYDAAYIALAEALDVVLVTGDARLSRASGVRCEIDAIDGASGGR